MLRTSSILGVLLGLTACVIDADSTESLEGTAEAYEDSAVSAAKRVDVHLLGRAMLGGPVVEGIPVLFYKRNGKLSGRTTTNAHGDASGSVQAGGAVTVVEAAGHHITTFFGVEPGDTLTVGDVNTLAGVTVPDTATLVVPPGPEPSGNQYLVQGPCTSSSFDPSTAVTVVLFPGCNVTTRPLIVTSHQENRNLAFTGYLYASDVLLHPGATTTLNGASWSPPAMFELALTGVPSNVVGSVGFGLMHFQSSQIMYQSFFTSAPVTGGTATAHIPVALGGDSTMTNIGFAFDTGGFNTILDYRSGQTTSLRYDVSGDFIAYPDPRRGGMTTGDLAPGGPVGPIGGNWTLIGSSVGDAVIATITVIDAAQEFMTPWVAVLPAGTLQYELPRLPPDLLDAWANHHLDSFQLRTIDTPATSYRDFLRDAEPLWRGAAVGAPSTFGKVRIGAP